MALFDSVYKLGSGLYGDSLFNHLKGWDDTISFYNEAYNQFPSIFLVTAGTSLGAFLLYYYIIDNPRSNRWLVWLSELIVLAISMFIFAYITVIVDVNSGQIAPSLVKYISSSNATLFGIYNAVLAVLFFFLISLLGRHWSRNCKHSPWTSLFTRLKHR